MVVFINILPSILISFDSESFFFSEDTLHIKHSENFLGCLDILEKVLLIQKYYVILLLPNFSPDLIRSYIKYISEEELLVALVYLTNDGKVAKKYKDNKIPHLSGARSVVELVSRVFLEPIE